MITETTNKEALLAAIGEAALNLTQPMVTLDETGVNTVPYEGSWTAGQLFRHVSKSTTAIAGALRKKEKPAPRDAGERIAELKKNFLDFSSKLKSPDFIVPEPGPYQKQAITRELNDAFETLQEAANGATLTELELLHFVLYHTQRHTHQMQKICAALHKA